MCLGVLLVDGQRAWKIHTVVMVECWTVFLCTRRNGRCTPVSNAAKRRCLVGSLIVLNSGYLESAFS